MSTDHVAVLKREAAKEPYTFTVDGSKTRFAIPHLADLDQLTLAELMDAHTGDLAFMAAFLSWAMEPKQHADLKKACVSRAMLNALWDAYQEHCGMKAGESSASTD